ncbi:hypothetical protein EsH8_IX_000636 [Colletotrichum jinshuiense]
MQPVTTREAGRYVRDTTGMSDDVRLVRNLFERPYVAQSLFSRRLPPGWNPQRAAWSDHGGIVPVDTFTTATAANHGKGHWFARMVLVPSAWTWPAQSPLAAGISEDMTMPSFVWRLIIETKVVGKSMVRCYAVF